MRNYWSYWSNMTRMAIDAQAVVGLRMMTFAGGGAAAQAEAVRMVSEKVDAANRATFDLMRGAPPERVLRGIHRTVRANRKRLTP